MTAFAGHDRMHAAQRKAREAMVKHHVRLPRRGRVAGAALLAELCLVYILLGVTAEAGCIDLHQDCFAVTTRAGRRHVRPLQREFALCVMIELGRLPCRFRVA